MKILISEAGDADHPFEPPVVNSGNLAKAHFIVIYEII